MAENREELPRTMATVAPNKRAPRIRVINVIAIFVAIVFALVAFISVERVIESELHMEQVNQTYVTCSNAARDLQEASDYLTTQTRLYVVTGKPIYLHAYLEELNVTDRRGAAVRTLEERLDDEVALTALAEALQQSNDLAVRELYAMRLVAEATGLETMPHELASVELSQADAASSSEEKHATAEEIVFGDAYHTSKTLITSSVTACSDDLLTTLDAEALASGKSLQHQLWNMRFVIFMLLAIMVFVILATVFLILWPLAIYTREVSRDEPLPLTGAFELQYLAAAYNTIYEETRKRTMQLRHAAERDALTGLYNRGSYDALLAERTENVALLLIDVDYFKAVNDTYGHNVGDAVLKKVATLIVHTFRASDYPCRMGGDEFAVIMTDMNPELSHVVASKIETMARELRQTDDGLPTITLSVGIAFSGHHPGEEDLYHAADKALYVTKERGRNGYSFYGEE